MLTLTDTAVEVIRGLSSRPGMPQDTGLRISPQGGDGDGRGLELSLSAGPDLGDEVVEESQARVYLAPDAALILADKVLDARVDEQGAVAFLLAPQQAGAG